MSRQFFEFYKCPTDAVRFECPDSLSTEAGYFKFGEALTCFGQTSTIAVAKNSRGPLHDISAAIGIREQAITLPFDPDEVADQFRFERYVVEPRASRGGRLGANPIVRDLYYLVRPLLPVSVRRILQRIQLRGALETCFPEWPVDQSVNHLFEQLMSLALKANDNSPIPFVWFWPEGANAAFVLTHDIETKKGVAFCPTLMDIDSEFGFHSSFQVVPKKRYEVTDAFLQQIKGRGFEVNVHDLNHDGNLFREREEFQRRAQKINEHAVRYGTRGFRSGALYRRLDWYQDLDISYDMSVPNVAHLDPQGGGCCTITPYFVGDILEIPVTETQDYSLFHILNQYSIDLWKQQTDIIVKGNGIINLITHPDYLIPEKARRTYRQLLSYLAERCSADNIWATLPAEVDRWWRARNKMQLVRIGDSWQVQGEGSDRARVAFAYLDGGVLKYTFNPATQYCRLDSKESIRKASDRRLDPPNSSGGSRERTSATLRSIDTTVQTLESAIQTETAESHHSELGTERQRIPGDEQDNMPFLEQKEVACEPAGPSELDRSQLRAHKSLRICMVAYTFYESDNRVMRYAETLAKQGHQVEVFVLQQGDDPSDELLCGVTVHRLQARVVNEKTRFSYAWRILIFLLRAFYQVAINDLRRRYDLVHVHSVPDFLVFSALVPRLRGTPVILDIHDILPEFYVSKFGAKKNSLAFRFMCILEKICAGFASHVIIANHLWKERLESRSLKPEKCSVVMNSPDRAIFRRSEKRPEKGDRFILLYPGTLNWHQGLDIAINAFAKISDQVPYADFHIYGEGPLKEQLIAMVRELGLEKRVMLSDMKRLREMPQLMEMADLGVVPKRKDGFGDEAFSTKTLEFMAMGVPLIVSDTTIDIYYFSNSIVRFFRGGDEDDLARCMLDLIQHPEKRRALVENSTAFVATCDWTAKKKEYLDLVAQLTH